jgi:hypothetical protein
MIFYCRQVTAGGHARLVLMVSLGAVDSRMLDLLVPCKSFTHTLVELV